MSSVRKVEGRKDTTASAPSSAPRVKAGPLNDPAAGVADYRYPSGDWETVCAADSGITVVGFSPEPLLDTDDAQGGLRLLVRDPRERITTIVGGGA